MLKEHLFHTGTATLSDFCNEFLNQLQGVNSDDLASELCAHGVNEKLAAFIVREKQLHPNNAHGVKLDIACSELPFPSSSKEELEKLKTIDDPFVKMFIVDCTSVLQHAFDEFKVLPIRKPLFNDFVVSVIMPEVEKNIDDYTHYNSRTFSLLSLCYPNEDFDIKAEHLDVEVIDDGESIDGYYKHIVEEYNKMHGVETKGKWSSFDYAFSNISRISPIWNNLKASEALRDKCAMIGGATTKVSSSDLINLFTGDYDAVPSTEPLANSISFDAIANEDKFNSLSHERQLQITNAIDANRSAFNTLMANSTREVLNNMSNFSPNYYNSVVNSHQDILQPYSMDMYGGGVGVDASLIDDTRKCVESVYNKYALWKQDNATSKVSKGLDFICNTVVPSVATHKKKCYAKYGKSASNQFFERLGQFPSLNFFNACDVEEHNNSSVASYSDGYADGYAKAMYGGSKDRDDSATRNILEKIVDSQKAYIEEFDKNYRNLKNAISNVNVSTSSREPSSIYLIANSLKTISISNRETPARLSGYYKGTNYNTLYNRAVKDVIKNIDASPYTSAFSEVKRVLNNMSSLQESSYTKSKNYRTELLRAPKRVSEFVGIYDSRMNQLSSLTFEDFNDVDIAIKSLYESITVTDKEEVNKRTRDQVDKYVDSIKRRDNVIREYYSNKELYIKSSAWQTSLYRETAAQNIISELINIKRAKMLYLNSVVEPVLMKYKTSSNKKKITKDVLRRLDTAAYMVKNQSRVADIRKEFGDIKTIFESDKPIAQVEVFKIIKCIKNAFLAFGYFDYIKFIYTELSIFPSDFNWQEFAENISTLVAVSTISISRRYNLRINQRDRDDMGIPLTQGALISILVDKCEGKFTDVQWSENNRHVFNDGFNTIAHKYGYVETEAEMIPEQGDNMVDNGETKRIQYAILKLPGAIDVIVDGNDVVDGMFEVVSNDTFDKFLAGTSKHNIADAIYKLVSNILPEQYFSVDNYGTYVQNGTSSLRPIYVLSKLDDYAIDVSATVDSIMNSDMEMQMIYKTLDSIMSNVMYAIDEFWRTYYTGTVQGIPLRVADVMTGGSVFDVDNDIATESTIIPEATPFYMCAFVIVQTYCELYTRNDEEDVDRPKPTLTNNTMSPIYKLVEVFSLRGDGATVDSITPQQMKKCIKVLNEIWNQSTGNNGAKLSQSIDLLFSELNALVVVATNYQRTIIETTGASDSMYKETLITDIENTVSDLVNNITEYKLRNVLTDPKRQIRMFEQTLANAYKAVSNETPSQRLSLLKRLITKKGSDTFDVNSDLYMFMDTVITPMLICTEAYSEVFGLYYKASNVNDVIAIDLTSTYINENERPGEDISDGASGTVENIYISEAIKNVINGVDADKYMRALILNRCANMYNKVVIHNSICEAIVTGDFKMPCIWNLYDVSTYPTEKEYKVEADTTTSSYDKNGFMAAYLTLLQLYPHMKNVNLMKDFFENTCNEFINDIRQYFNAFYAYPDVTEFVRQTVSKEFNNWKQRFEGKVKEFRDNVIPDNDDLTKYKKYYGPYSYTENINIPAYQYNAKIPAIKKAGENDNDGRTITMDWTEDKIKIITSAVPDPNTQPAEIARHSTYEWSDWVVYQLAKCDRINYCLPYKFVEIIYELELNKYIKAASLEEGTKGKIIWNTVSGSYDKTYNIITQNIMLRSQHDKNKTEISSYHKGYISSIVSICPYIINTLTAVKNIMPQNYNNVDGYRVEKMIGELITGVQNLYNEFLPSAPYVSFMAETPEESRDSNAHIYGDALELIHLKSSLTMSASDFTKMTWANKYFFNGLQDISFPVYNTKNQFEGIEKYAREKINNAAFHELYESDKQVIGKNAWMCLIAKSYNKRIIEYDNEISELYRVIKDALNNLFFLDNRVITQFVNYIIDMYRSVITREQVFSIYQDMYNLQRDTKLYAIVNILPRGIGSAADTKFDNTTFNDIVSYSNNATEQNEIIYVYANTLAVTISIEGVTAPQNNANYSANISNSGILNIKPEQCSFMLNTDLIKNGVVPPNGGVIEAFQNTCLPNYYMYLGISNNTPDISINDYIQNLVLDVLTSAATTLNSDSAFNELILNQQFVEDARVGFTFGNTENSLIGGSSAIVPLFINVGNIVGSKMFERMQSAYKIKSTSKAVIETIISTRFERNDQDAVKEFYNMILVYFKQRNITLSSIYNHVIYPNILYGAAVFRIALKKFVAAIQSAIGTNNTNSTKLREAVNNMIRYIQIFITNDKGYNYHYNRNEYGPNRLTQEQLNNAASIRENRLGDNANPLSPTQSVSINSKAITELVKILDDEATRLYASNFPSAVMYFDAIASIITMVFLIVRETGVYDPETKRNRSLIGVNRDPFDINA